MAQEKEVLVKEQEDSAELVEVPLEEEEARREVQVAASMGSQMTRMKVTTIAILVVPVEARAMVPEDRVDVCCQAADRVQDHREALLAGYLEAGPEVMLGPLEWEQEDLLELVEPALEGEEATVMMTKATVLA